MTIRVSAKAGLLFILAACGDGSSTANGLATGDVIADDFADVETISVEDCLPALWKQRPSRNEAYDRANDKQRGGSLSCGLSTTASEFRDVLADLRLAADTGDRERLLSHVGVPMTYVDRDGHLRELASMADVEAIYEEIFTPDILAELSKIRLEDASVVPNEGIFFELGAVWLVVPEGESGPQLVTVNQQAAEEAAALAAIEAAETNGE
ncbi:MAG: hypothetical protein WA906_07400 [Pacificimonas sp.]